VRLDYSPESKSAPSNTTLYVYQVAGWWFSFAGEVFPESALGSVYWHLWLAALEFCLVLGLLATLVQLAYYNLRLDELVLWL
jgi:hypothetical protein